MKLSIKFCRFTQNYLLLLNNKYIVEMALNYDDLIAFESWFIKTIKQFPLSKVNPFSIAQWVIEKFNEDTPRIKRYWNYTSSKYSPIDDTPLPEIKQRILNDYKRWNTTIRG